MDALQLLKSDHDTVRELFSQFKEAKESADTQRLASVQGQIFHELDVHTAIEEEVFYPEAAAIGGKAEELVAEGKEEHHVVDVLMAEIKGLEPGEDAWVAKMTVLIENVEHHAEEEEQDLFPQLRDAFGEEGLVRIGDKLAQAKQRHGTSSGGMATEGRSEALRDG